MTSLKSEIESVIYSVPFKYGPILKKSFRFDNSIERLISKYYHVFIRTYYLKDIKADNKKKMSEKQKTKFERVGLCYYAAIVLDVVREFGLTSREAFSKLPKDLNLDIKQIKKCLLEYKKYKV